MLQADDRQFGLVVDGVNDTEEIVVKPLGKELKGLSAFAGATIMGDGKVALILDVLGIAQRANVISEVRDRNLAKAPMRPPRKRQARDAAPLRRARGADGHSAVARRPARGVSTRAAGALGRPQRRSIPGTDPAPHRPLRRWRLPLEADAERRPLQVVVYSEQGRSVGLVVERILDIVEETLGEKLRGGRPGILGSAVIAGKVTDLLDVHGVIRATDPHFFDITNAA